MATRVIPQFHWADYLIFALSLTFCIGIGIFHAFFGKKNATSADQLVGGRNMKAIPVAMSCIMGSLAPPFFIGIPIEIYCYGPMYSTILVGFLLTAPLGAHGYMPPLHKLKIISSYEYLEKRFGKFIRSLSSCLYILMMVFYMGVVIYTPARAFTQVTGISVDIIIVVICVICTFYTALGGIRAVVWTDVFQTTIIFIGLLVLLIKGCVDSGGPTRVFDIAAEGGRLDFSEVSPDPTVRHTWWTQSIGGIAFALSMSIGNQAVVQRALSISALKNTQIALYLYLAGTVICLLLVSGIGFVLYAYYYECDPITSNAVSATDQVIPLFMMDILGKVYGIPGLFTAGIFAATLSSMAAGVNALAAVLYTDIIQPLYKFKRRRKIGERAGSIITKSTATVMGLVTMGMAYLAPHLGPTLLQIALSLFGMIGGPLVGLFTMAIFIPCVNQWGALAGLLSSLVMTFWVSIGAIVHPTPPQMLPLRTDGCPVENTTFSTTAEYSVVDVMNDPLSSLDVSDLYKLSYMWYGPMAMAVACFVGFLVSLLTGGHKQKVHHSLLFNYQRCCCRSVCHRCCCPVDYSLDEKPEVLPEYRHEEKAKVLPSYESTLEKEAPEPSLSDVGHVNLSYISDCQGKVSEVGLQSVRF